MQVRNDRTGEIINSRFSHRQVIDEFLRLHENDQHWLWFHLHRACGAGRDTVKVGTAIQFVCDSFLVAIGRGLKRPSIRVSYLDRRFKLYLSRRGTVCLKTGQLDPGTKDPVGNEEYAGCFVNGNFLVNDRRELLPAERAFFNQLNGGDPVDFMAQCSKDLNRCCYCNMPLEDPTSKALGYGPVCADHWGLYYGPAQYAEGAPSFANAYRYPVPQLCAAIRQDPHGDAPWFALRDALLEGGYPIGELKSPAPTVVVPRGDSTGDGVEGEALSTEQSAAVKAKLARLQAVIDAF